MEIAAPCLRRGGSGKWAARAAAGRLWQAAAAAQTRQTISPNFVGDNNRTAGAASPFIGKWPRDALRPLPAPVRMAPHSRGNMGNVVTLRRAVLAQ